MDAPVQFLMPFKFFMTRLSLVMQAEVLEGLALESTAGTRQVPAEARASAPLGEDEDWAKVSSGRTKSEAPQLNVQGKYLL